MKKERSNTMLTKLDYEIWKKWCSRPGLSEEELMRLDTVDTVLTAYAKEHPNVFAIDDIEKWVLMPKSTSEIIAELQPVLHLEQFDVVLWLGSHGYPLVPDSCGQQKWNMYERRYIDD